MPDPTSPRPSRWPLAVASAATALLLLDVTVVYLAAPALGAGVEASFSELQWVVDAYALAMAAVLLPAGALADRWGRRRTFLAGLALFGIGSIACASAQSALWLDLARALQGIGGAGLFATSLALIGASYEARERGVALGIWGAVSGAALAAGPVVGGLVIEALDWRWIFWLNVPAVAGLALLARARVAESRRPSAAAPDLRGALLLALALTLLVGALLQGRERGWSSPEILGSLAGSVVLFAVFVRHSLRAGRPMLDPGLFRRRRVSAMAVVTLLQSIAIYPVLLFLALELQGVFGFDALEAGLRVLPVTGALLVVAPIAGALTGRLAVGHLLAAGLAVTAAGLLLATGSEVADGWASLLPGFVVLGIGIGIVSPALASAIIGALPDDEAGLASGIGNSFRQVGIALGVAILGVVFQAATPDSLHLEPLLSGELSPSPAAAVAFHDGLEAVLRVAALVAALGALASLALFRGVAPGPAEAE